MKSNWKKRLLAGTMSLVMTASMVPALGAGSMALADSVVQSGAPAAGTWDVDSLTLQPGETTASINLNWYAPAGTTSALVWFGGQTVEANVRALTAPTQLNESKYTDTGKLVCEATVSGLAPATQYTYLISVDGGATWSQEYSYTTPAADEFTFAFTSDPQIKEDQSINADGWNPSDGTNQTGWATMMETIANAGATLVVSAGDQVEDQSWGKSSEYEAFFAPEEMASIAYAPAVGNHDRHYMFDDHFNLPNEMAVDGSEGSLAQVKTTFRGQNNGTSQSHGNYIQATQDEIANQSNSNGVTPNEEGYYDFAERREMETKGNYYYLYDNVLFVTLNTGAYPGGNDAENVDNAFNAQGDNSEAEAIVENFRTTLNAATSEYAGQYQWLIVTHHKSTQTVAKHSADSDIENYVDAGFESLMDEFNVDFVLGGHDHVYSRSYVLKDGVRNSERLDTINDPDGTIYLTGNCCSDMQYYEVGGSLDKTNNADYPILADGTTGSENYSIDNLPYGNQEWNQEYSPAYALFDVEGNTIKVNVYNLDGDSVTPDSKLIDSFTVTKNASEAAQITGYENGSAQVDLTQVGRYDAGMTNPDGGVMEIVSYNTVTGWAYAVNGNTGNLTAIALKDMEQGTTIDALDGNDIDVKSLVEDDSFTYGDMTSVSVSPDGATLAVALQAEDYTASGRVALFTCNADGTLTFQKTFVVGVQPDMVTFTPDGSKILTADEGEPREGYGEGIVDPAGSVSVIDAATGEVAVLGFDKFDAQTLADQGVLMGKVDGQLNSAAVDLEPEYITVAQDGNTAYVTLQEANAIATIDLTAMEITKVQSLGFADLSLEENAIDVEDDGQYAPVTLQNAVAAYMPDGIASYTVNGKTYLVTANEGDAREWGDYCNEAKEKLTTTDGVETNKVRVLDQDLVAVPDESKNYLFGGRGFTIFDADTMELVYSSANEMEVLTAKYLPDYFNCSNDNVALDDRSQKKGPEVESVTLGQVGDATYAFVGLERIGGVMVYDVTDPANVSYVNYINSRDFSQDIAGDDSPEGLCFIPAAEGRDALLLTACEVSGTVAVYGVSENASVPETPENPGDPDIPGTDPEQPTDGQPDGTPGQDAETEIPQEGSVQTGDLASPFAWIALAVLAAGSGTLLVMKRRKNH